MLVDGLLFDSVYRWMFWKIMREICKKEICNDWVGLLIVKLYVFE